MFTAPLFLLVASVIQYVSSENYAYVKLKIPEVVELECTDIPNDGVCPRNHKIPDFSNSTVEERKSLDFSYNKTLFNETITRVFNMVLNPSAANEKCKKAYRVYFCSQVLPDCEDNNEFFYINGEKTLESCEQAMKDCSALPSSTLTSLFNCTMTAIKISKRKISCQVYPNITENDPYPCSKGNFVGPSSFAFNERNNSVLNLHNMMKKYESKLDKKCVNDVAEMICEAPTCTRDEKYIVDLVSKQDCQKIMGCVNVTKDANFISNIFKFCGDLADATTAKTIPLSDVYFTSVQSTVQPSGNDTGLYISTKPTANVSTKPKPTISTKLTANTSTKLKANVSTKPTGGTIIPEASIAIMFFAFLYFMQHLHYV